MARKPGEVMFNTLEFLSQHPDGRPRADIAADAGVENLALMGSHLDKFKNLGYVRALERGIWAITPAGNAWLEAQAGLTGAAPVVPGETIEEEIPLPGEFEKFQEIGRTLGLRGDFLKVASEHIFRGEPHDLTYVWTALNELFLRPDVTKRWYHLWARTIKQTIPPEIAKVAGPAPSTVASVTGAGVATGLPKMYSLVGDQILPDPDGELTFLQALQLLTVQRGGVPQDKASDLLTALAPYLVKQPEGDKDTTLALEIIKLFNTQQGGAKGITVDDILTVVDRVKGSQGEPQAPPSLLDEAERLADIGTKLRNLFTSAPPANQGEKSVNPVYVTLPGAQDGSPVSIPFESWLKLDDHQWERRKEQEELKRSQENAAAVRDFLGKLVKVAGRFVESESEGE